MKTLSMFFVVSIFFLTGCTTVGELSRTDVSEVEQTIRDVAWTVRAAGQAMEDLGESAERARDGIRRTAGAFQNGVLFIPVENWHNRPCRLRVYSRGQIIAGVEVEAGGFSQFSIQENLVEGSSEATVTSACGGHLEKNRLEYDFRRGWYRIGGHAEHEVLVLSPPDRRDRYQYKGGGE